MDICTHQAIDRQLCGTPTHLEPGCATVELKTTANMAADDKGLVHGGFIFGLADYAAMIAVNHPNVVLGAADAKFLKPVRVGQVAVAEATVQEESGKKRYVAVDVRCEGKVVLQALMTCFVLDNHVLDL